MMYSVDVVFCCWVRLSSYVDGNLLSYCDVVLCCNIMVPSDVLVSWCSLRMYDYVVVSCCSLTL